MRALIVDDDEFSLELLEDVLAQLGHEVERAADGAEALEKLRGGSIHLVITDWEMPRMNGLELCRAVREQDFASYIFIIMLTSRDSGAQKIEGLHAGADSFLTKPLSPEELVVSLKTAERVLALETRDLTMFALAKLSESRAPGGGSHLERVQGFSRLLAQYMSTTEKYHDIIDHEFVRLIYQTSPLHDIGKVAMPDSVLLKPGPLTQQEMTIMRSHVMVGAQTLRASLDKFPSMRFLQMACDIAVSHHERWDGQGYPSGTAGTNIPIAGRIVALADVYDAMTTRRIYRDAMSHAQAKGIIIRQRGAHFDPDVVDAFLRTEQQFLAIAERLRDDASSPSPHDIQLVPHEQPQLVNGVLVVDDDEVIRDLLVNFLNALAFDCVACADASSALEVLERDKPRLIISDWEMPGMDGLEFCRRVRSRSAANHVHFLMLTVHAGKEELSRAFDAGVDDFISKPFTEADLMSRLRAGMRALSLHDELTRQNIAGRQLNEQLTHLNDRLQKLAITDDLTGLYNRRQAIQRLEENWALCQRYHRALAVVLLDIDHFKQVNDVHGHAAGDAVLRGVADILRSCVRSTDIACRVGGEEFLLILPCQTVQEAQVCAERARTAVSESVFRYRDLTLRVTLSAGIATHRKGIEQCSELLKEADEALYQAKNSGRNTVCIFPGATTPHESATHTAA